MKSYYPMMKRLFSYGLIPVLFLTIVLSGCGGPSPTFSIAESLVPVTNTTQFPTGVNDLGGNCTSVTYPYYIAKYEVTYSLWKEVYNWALTHGYTFANAGARGGSWTSSSEAPWPSGHETDPVTTISWRDAVVWCNALTEYYNAKNGKHLTCAYQNGGNIIRDSLNDTTICDNLTDDGHSTTGFRLPTSMEWELAARYKGSDSSNGAIECPVGSGQYWTPGNYASGATGDYNNATATQAAAWYWDNSKVSSSPDTYSTHPVGQKPASGNALGLFDMSGNVAEWCFNIYSGSNRIRRGGVYYDGADSMRIDFMSYDGPYRADDYLGFRPVRTQ